MARNDNSFRLIDPDGNLNLNMDSCKYYTINEFNTGFDVDRNHYLLLNQNLQSFNAKQAIFEAFLDSLLIPINTMVITETWIDKNTRNFKDY